MGGGRGGFGRLGCGLRLRKSWVSIVMGVGWVSIEMGVGGVGKGSGNVLRKYRRMTVACSSAISYVASENVVHSIERSKSVSDSSGGGWRLMIEGKVSDSGGSPWMIGVRQNQKRKGSGSRRMMLTPNTFSIVRSAVTIATLSTFNPCSFARVSASLRSLMSTERPSETKKAA